MMLVTRDGIMANTAPRLISHEIIFEVFQCMWPSYLNVTDRRTDGRTTCHDTTVLRVAL